jgi:hypothetical protein
MTTPEQARDAVLRKLTEYAEGRKKDVARCAESPHLAGLMVQKYGYGLCDAFDEIFGRSLAAPTYGDVDRAVTEIDPQWQENAKMRWAGRPATITY